MTNSDNSSKFNNCPCGEKLGYEKCCQPLHNGQIFAQSAEQLMRSRYSAFVMQQWSYLVETAYPESTNTNAINEIKSWGISKDWCSLKIIKARHGKPQDDTGEVEFVAFYKEMKGNHQSTLCQHHEHSLFKRIDSRWMFTDGTALEPVKINRNDPCPCTSGKKAKKCCLA